MQLVISFHIQSLRHPLGEKNREQRLAHHHLSFNVLTQYSGDSLHGANERETPWKQVGEADNPTRNSTANTLTHNQEETQNLGLLPEELRVHIPHWAIQL